MSFASAPSVSDVRPNKSLQRTQPSMGRAAELNTLGGNTPGHDRLRRVKWRESGQLTKTPRRR
jgi:hypothetical protein